MPIFTKEIELIDANAFSGSMESLRNELGIYWETETTPNGTVVTTFKRGLEGSIDYTLDQNSQISYKILALGGITSHSERLRYVELQPAFQVTASTDKIVPNFKIPGRFYGNEAKIRSDSEWKAYLLGGTYGEKTYPGIYSTEVFDDYGTSYGLPYGLAEFNSLYGLTGGGYRSSSIVYHYNQHLPKFESWAATTSTILLPNIAQMGLLSETSASIFPISEVVTRDGEYPESLETILQTSLTGVLPHTYYTVDLSEPNKYVDVTKNLRDYLEALPLYPLSDKTVSTISIGSNNLLYNKDSSNLIFDDIAGGDARTILGNYPMYTSIDFYRPDDEGTSFRDIFNETDFSSELLSLLAAVFERNSTEKTYVTKVKQDTISNKELNETETVSSTGIRVLDAVDALTSGYTLMGDLAPLNVRSLLVPGLAAAEAGGDQFAEGALSLDPLSNSTRFLNSYTTLTTLTRLLSLLDSDYATGDIAADLNHFESNIPGKNGMYTLLQKAGTPNYKETIAYRLEKTDALGNVQNVWFYNESPNSSRDTGEGLFQYWDSQVKYGETYTYNIYAYVMITGMKYRMADLRIGKNIGTGSIVNSSADKFCVQFQDPTTGEIAEQLFASSDSKWSDYSGVQYHGVYNELATDNTFSTNAEALSTYPYLADFNLYYEPTLQILQIPVTSNTVTILDNPAPGLDVVPFQVIDNSQKIGFYIQAEVYQPADTFPTIIQTSDETYKTNYLASTGLSESDEIGRPPVSDQAFIQIFRRDTKPATYKDFNNHLYKTISLKIRGDVSTDMSYYQPSKAFHDTIETNKKYYYVMRLLNAHQEPGSPSAIIEAELVDDGGYKYALFKELFEEDLADEVFVNPSIKFKKLFQIIPNFQQLALDTSNVDFTQTAESQISALSVGAPGMEESIFDQKFKIRLTSKKTGKKIDLNLTFNLTEEV